MSPSICLDLDTTHLLLNYYVPDITITTNYISFFSESALVQTTFIL